MQITANKAIKKIPASHNVQEVRFGINILIAKFTAVPSSNTENAINSSKSRFFSASGLSDHNFSVMILYKGLLNAIKVDILAIKQSNIIKISSYKVLINFDFKKMTFVLFLHNYDLTV